MQFVNVTNKVAPHDHSGFIEYAVDLSFSDVLLLAAAIHADMRACSVAVRSLPRILDTGNAAIVE